MTTAVTTSTNALLASFEISCLKAKNKKPHTIGETLLLTSAMKMCEIMHGEKYGEALETIPLSNNTVMRRIESMSKDIKEQLLTRIKCSPKFALQIDESTDAAGLDQLLVFVRYCFEENIQEEFMFCLPLSERCIGSDILKAVNDCFTAQDISWANCVGICTDGAVALTGHKKGFQAEVQQTGTHVNFIHCIIHREALASRDLEPKLHSVLQQVVKVVNFVKARPLKSRLFAVLCEEIQEDHKSLLLHSKVRWLSRGKVLKRLVEQKDEVRRFLQDSGSPLSQHFLDGKWLALLSQLSDILDKLNGLNSSLQGPNVTVFSFLTRFRHS
jgi:hypothetical protein